MEDHKQLLEYFLKIPVDSADGLFTMFSALPGAVCGTGEKPLERFVYVPGNRKDRVVLVAHGDTVWDAAYGRSAVQALAFADGMFYSEDPSCGIGADDRAGCAMLWALRESGHSLLLVDGEEKGKHGAKLLRQKYPALFRQLNDHCFMMEFDWSEAGGCLYNQVDNTDLFKAYITEVLGFRDSQCKGGCDLQILCQKICGVNVGIGYHNCHKATETLDVSQWEQSYQAVSAFLAKPQQRFSIPLNARTRKKFRQAKSALGDLLRKLHVLPQRKP